jgi:hypothetical protein
MSRARLLDANKQDFQPTRVADKPSLWSAAWVASCLISTAEVPQKADGIAAVPKTSAWCHKATHAAKSHHSPYGTSMPGAGAVHYIRNPPQ